MNSEYFDAKPSSIFIKKGEYIIIDDKVCEITHTICRKTNRPFIPRKYNYIIEAKSLFTNEIINRTIDDKENIKIPFIRKKYYDAVNFSEETNILEIIDDDGDITTLPLPPEFRDEIIEWHNNTYMMQIIVLEAAHFTRANRSCASVLRNSKIIDIRKYG